MKQKKSPCTGTRRQFFWQAGGGFAGVALASMLDDEGFFTRQAAAAEKQGITKSYTNPLVNRDPHFQPKVKRVISLFMYGGPPSMDTWDYKPELQRLNGKTIRLETRPRSFTNERLLGSKRKFRRLGESGQWASDAFPHINEHIDDMCVIKSLYCDTFAHGSALIQLNSGQVIQGYPSVGSWVGYGLGTINQNLPGYVVMLDPRGGPIAGAANWSSGFMPAAFQGTHLRSKGDPILDLSPKNKSTRSMQRDQIETINALNAQHLIGRQGYTELEARIANYQLAYQLQSAAPEALDLRQESQKTLDMYGIGTPRPKSSVKLGPTPFGTQCLYARRLVERGVRFVQVYSGGGHGDQNWDAHGNVERNLEIHGPEIDKPIAGLLKDLKQRGLLDETLVVWGGEFGRQPVEQGNGGRDHNPRGFLYWMAGGGVKGGYSHGETDPIGFRAAEKRHHVRDLHATILHLMGLDHEKLTFFYGGLNHKLTGVQDAHVIKEVLA